MNSQNSWHREIAFANQYTTDEEFGKYAALIFYFISTFRFKVDWDQELFPFLEALKTQSVPIDDWDSFYGIASICFRYEYVMFTDPSLIETGRCILTDAEGEVRLSSSGNWLLDTEYIRTHYTEYALIGLDRFIEIGHKWVDEILCGGESKA